MFLEAAVLDAHCRHAQAVLFTNDGKRLVSAGQDACVRLWSVPDFTEAGTFEGHKASVNSLSFTVDGKLFATGSTDKTVRVWSFPEGRCLHALENQLTGVFAPGGDCIATIGLKGQVILWEGKSGKQINMTGPLDKRTTTVAFTPDGGSLLIGGTGPIHRVAVASFTKEGELQGHKAIVACLRVSPDGKWLASTAADGYLRFWSTADWAEVRSVKLEGGGGIANSLCPAERFCDRRGRLPD